MDTCIAIVLLALISSSTGFFIKDGKYYTNTSDIDVIIDGEVRDVLLETYEVAEVYLGEDRRENITFRCKEKPIHGNNASFTWALKSSDSFHYRNVKPTDAIPTEFEPGPHTTGGADLIFHVTDLNNEEWVRYEIKTYLPGPGVYHIQSSSMVLRLAYPVAADVRQTNGGKFTVAASGNPDYHGLGYTRLDIVHEGNTIGKYIPGRISNAGFTKEQIDKKKVFHFGVTRNLQYENITLKIVSTQLNWREEVLWSKLVRVADFDAPNRGSRVGVTHAVIIAVVCFIVILTQRY